MWSAAEPTATVEVSARSLLLALTAAIEDDLRDANGDGARSWEHALASQQLDGPD